MIDNAVILVTGATGSFGRVCVRYILNNFKPRKLIVFSRDELKQWEMAQEFTEEQMDTLRFFLGDVRDLKRLERAFHDVNVVIHAAALKQVPALEYNPSEAIHTNVLGAENIINAAIDKGVGRVICLSTDKAVNPINLYGATKLCSDKLFVAANRLSDKHGTKFSVVRYGNVIASRGSVVQLFRKCVKENTPIPITDERMTRFWITLDQAVDFVLKRMEDMKGGEIFVPKMGSLKITEVAQILAPDRPLKVIGIRPGEKLHETMIPIDEALYTVDMGGHFIIHSPLVSLDRYKPDIGQLVPEGFHYSSNNNDHWLTEEEFLDMVKVAKA